MSGGAPAPGGPSAVGAVPVAPVPSENDTTLEDKKDLQRLLGGVEKIEKKTAKLTSVDQIFRLVNRPGAKFFALNPFEVLNVPWQTPQDEVKKAYKKLSILVHPDRNKNSAEATKAFEIVNNAFKRLDDAKKRVACVELGEAAEKEVLKAKKQERIKARKEGVDDETTLPLDDSDTFNERVNVELCKLFVELEKRREELKTLDMSNAKRELDEKEELRLKRVQAQQEKESWEKGRNDRVDGWRDFNKSAGIAKGSKCPSSSDKLPKKMNILGEEPKKKKRKLAGSFRPPRLKQETKP